jgi:nucleoid-associated protein YgaU
MQNKTPIVVLTGLGIVAAAAVAGLTRDQWMGHKTEIVASAPAPETPKAPAEPATTAGSATTSEQPAATAEQPSATAEQPAATTTTPAAESGQQTAAAQTATQPEQPAAGTVPDQPKVPAFDTVRVEKTGEAVIAGTAAPGSTVVVKLDGKVIGETTANGDGAFVMVPATALPVGSGALTLESKSIGDAAATPSQQSVAVIVPAAEQPQEALVAVVSPDQPTRVLQKPEVKQDASSAPSQPATQEQAAEKPAKLVSIDAVDYDANGNIVFSGQGDAGNTARVYIDNSFIGDSTVGQDGRWTFSGTADVTPGVHTLRVDGLDTEGKVVNRVEVPFVREQQNKVVAANPPAGSTAASQPEATTPTKVAPGTTDQPAASPSAQPKEGRIVIQPGNNLWRISRVLYGDGSKFTTLYEANKDQIRNPDRIYPGQVFKTPDVAPTSESIDPKRRDPLTPAENAAPGQ